MTRFAGPILVYLALIGLIITTGISAFGRVQHTLGSQINRLTRSLSDGTGGGPPDAWDEPGMDALSVEVFPVDRLPAPRLAEYSEAPGRDEPGEPRSRASVAEHMALVEGLASAVSDGLAGR